MVKNEDVQTIDLIVNSLDEGDHPFHLHGHSFFIMGVRINVLSMFQDWQVVATSQQGVGRYVGQALNFHNPMRRDTVTLQGYSWTVLRFTTDNPGVRFTMIAREDLALRYNYYSFGPFIVISRGMSRTKYCSYSLFTAVLFPGIWRVAWCFSLQTLQAYHDLSSPFPWLVCVEYLHAVLDKCPCITPYLIHLFIPSLINYQLLWCCLRDRSRRLTNLAIQLEADIHIYSPLSLRAAEDCTQDNLEAQTEKSTNFIIVHWAIG